MLVKILAIAICLVILSCDAVAVDMTGVGAEGVSVDTGQLPNILFVTWDDVGREDLDLYGAAPTSTPNLDGYAASGVKFDNFFTAPVCAAARAAWLSGKYSYRTGISGPIGDTFNEPTFLNATPSYWHGVSGKGGVGSRIPLATQLWHRYGADEFNGFAAATLTSANQQYDGEYYDFSAVGGVLSAPINEYVDAAYSGDVITDRAMDMITDFEARDPNKPWFLYVNLYAPVHTNLDQPPGKSCSPNSTCRTDMIDYGDDNLKELIDHVDLTDTLVIFVSDNGTTVGSCKGSELVCGSRVPAIAFGWGVSTTGTITELVSGVDLFSTFIEMGRGQNPTSNQVDGCPIMHLLDPSDTYAPPAGWDDSCTHPIVFFEGGGNTATYDAAGYKLLWTGAGVELAMYSTIASPTDETTDICAGDCDANLTNPARDAWIAQTIFQQQAVDIRSGL